MQALVTWLSSPAAARLAGIVALSVLLGLGTLPLEAGLPLLAGLVGYHASSATKTQA